MTTHRSAPQLPGHLVQVGELATVAEISALLGSGRLHRVVPGLYSERPPMPADRGWAVALVLRKRILEQVVLSRMTAAWIHGAAPRPDLLDCSAERRRTVRFGAEEDPHVRRRFTGYSPYEYRTAGPASVTSPLRTCADLALYCSGPRADTALATMLAAPDLRCAPEVVCAVIEALPRVPHARRAQERVRALAGSGLTAQGMADPALAGGTLSAAGSAGSR